MKLTISRLGKVQQSLAYQFSPKFRIKKRLIKLKFPIIYDNGKDRPAISLGSFGLLSIFILSDELMRPSKIPQW